MNKKSCIFILAFLFLTALIFARVDSDISVFELRHAFFKEQMTSVSFMQIVGNDRDSVDPSSVGLDELEFSEEIVFPSAEEINSRYLDYVEKKNSSSLFYIGCSVFTVSFNYNQKNTELDFFRFRLGLNVFDTDRLISIDRWKSCDSKFFVPVFVELNLLDMVFDDCRWFYNPEINLGVDFSLIVGRNKNFGVTVNNRFSARNIMKQLKDGESSIERGLRGEIGTYRFSISIFFRITESLRIDFI